MRLSGIEKKYGTRSVLSELSIEIEEGKVACILGKSGAGKTTLLNLIAGLDDFHGEISPMPKSVGYVFQEDRLISYLTVRQNLQFVGGRDEFIDQLLLNSGLEKFAEKRVGTLSGGEKRRVAILRAFCVESDIVLLDEPFSALDTVTKESMLALTLALIQSSGKAKTAVFVTHDLDEALCIADKIAVLEKGRIVFEMNLPPRASLREYGSMLKERGELLNILKTER